MTKNGPDVACVRSKLCHSCDKKRIGSDAETANPRLTTDQMLRASGPNFVAAVTKNGLDVAWMPFNKAKG